MRMEANGTHGRPGGVIVDESSLRQRADAMIAHLRKGIEAKTGRSIPVILVGALRTGLFSGTKEKRYSHNQACAYDHVLEIDLRIIDQTPPHDPEWIDTVSSLFRPSDVVRKHSMHWDRRGLQQTTMYRYEDASDLVDGTGSADIGVEYELCLNQTPYVEISPYWKQLFSQEELVEQRQRRNQLRSFGASLDIYHQFKRAQILEAQWRLLAAIHLEVAGEDATDHPRFSELGQPVAGLVERWATSAHGDPPLARPSSANSWTNFAASIPLPPARADAPMWVVFAEQYQQQASSAREA